MNSLIKKGYVRKIQSEDDKREYHLEVTDKYYDYYNMNAVYVRQVTERMRERFTGEELEVLEKVLSVMSSELMPEVKI